MPTPNFSRMDLLALGFAAIGTLMVVQLRPSPCAEPTPEVDRAEPAIEGLIDEASAVEVGSWWLDEPATSVEFGFDPEHERLVWRVSGGSDRVLLDAETGDALAFEFDRS